MVPLMVVVEPAFMVRVLPEFMVKILLAPTVKVPLIKISLVAILVSLEIIRLFSILEPLARFWAVIPFMIKVDVPRLNPPPVILVLLSVFNGHNYRP